MAAPWSIPQVATVSPNSANRFKGLVAEILVYGSDLSPADITAVEDHLVTKYLIPEPATLALLGVGILVLSARRRR